MKGLVAAVLVALAAPAGAHAAEARLVSQEVPLRGGRTLAERTPTFDLVGLHWKGSGEVGFRTRSVTGRWSAWRTAAPEAEDLPDLGREASATKGWRIGNPYWTGLSDRIAYRLRGDVRRLRAYFVSSQVVGVPPRALSIAGSPAIVTRSGWGADESIRRHPPRYAAAVHFAVVHHTAGTNSYTPQQSAAIVRGIELYHVRGNGWDDLGYNFLVDKYGQVFEGRYGGVDRNVIGAHAEGFNTGSTGIAVLGNYGETALSAKARTALAQLLAWRLDVAHVDPLSTLMWPSGGNARFPAGTPVSLRAVSGHRDTGFTTCPGNLLYAALPGLARTAGGLGLPKVYAPSVRGRLGTPVRFVARLSAVLPWTVTISDSAGTQLAVGSGTGTTVDWTWDATLVPQGRYRWTLTTPGARPASGTIGVAAGAFAMSGVTARPRAITPNGDSVADSTVVSYTLSEPATVTAVLRDAAGSVFSTLFSGPRPAGRNSFRFAAEGVPDGSYAIELTARNAAGREVRATVAIVVDRTLAGFEAEPAVFSPNGDGRVDRVTFTFVLTSRVEAALRIYRGKNWVAAPFRGTLEAGSQQLTWDGSKRYGRLLDGRYRAVLAVAGPLGTRMQSATFVSDTTPPRLELLSVRPLRFRVSEPGTLKLLVNGKRLDQPVPAGIVRVRYPFVIRTVRAQAEDAAMNRSRAVAYP
jgi:hypothetical protein